MTATDAEPGAAPLTGRRRLVHELLDLSVGRGLEIGPLTAPLAPRSDHPDVRYADVLDRPGLVAYYADHQRVDTDRIPEIDHPLTGADGVVRSLSEATRGGAPFDWVLASHVVEHVPDLIGWLADLAGVLADEGSLLLIVPDRRFTWDFHRHQTSVGQMLEAHRRGDTRPSPRAVYDNYRQACQVDRRDAWAGAVPGEDRRFHQLEEVRSLVARAEAGEYVDCHVWTFTPTSFVDQVAELGRLGLSDLVVEKLRPTRRRRDEFYVVLTRVPRGSDPATTIARHEDSVARLTPRAGRRFLGSLRIEVGPGPTDPRVRDLRRELDELRGSRRWRVGGWLTWPSTGLRRAARRVAR